MTTTRKANSPSIAPVTPCAGDPTSSIWLLRMCSVVSREPRLA